MDRSLMPEQNISTFWIVALMIAGLVTGALLHGVVMDMSDTADPLTPLSGGLSQESNVIITSSAEGLAGAAAEFTPPDKGM